MKECSLYRNDELFLLLKKTCARDLKGSGKNTDKTRCRYERGSDGTDYISIDSFSMSQDRVIIEFKRKSAVNRVSPLLRKKELIPNPTSVKVIYGNQSKEDASNIIKLPGYRACSSKDQVSRSLASKDAFKTFVHAIETYLVAALPVGYLKKSYMRADSNVFEGAQEFSGVSVKDAQIHPTRDIYEFASAIDASGTLESTARRFRKLMRKIPPYSATPFSAIAGRAAARFVCRRAAHEIIASGYKFGCGDNASVFMAALKTFGIQTRLLKVVDSEFDKEVKDSGHDLVEVLDPNENRWVLVDPTFGRVYRSYDGESAFTTFGFNWIRMGSWQSNWDAGCYDVNDLTRMRASSKKSFDASPYEFTDVEMSISDDAS